MTAGVVVPPGLADLPPGPGLAAALAQIDVSGVPNGGIVEVLRAEARQLAHQQARVFAAMAEVGRCQPATDPDAVARSTEPRVEAIQEIGPGAGASPPAPRSPNTTWPSSCTPGCPPWRRRCGPGGSTGPRHGCSSSTPAN